MIRIYAKRLLCLYIAFAVSRLCVEFMLVPWIEEWLCLGGEQAIIGKIRARTDIADLEVEACTWNMDGWVGI